MEDLRKDLIERRMVEVDPELAKHYLTFNTYENQRNVRFQHVDNLAAKMKSGLFRFGQIAFVSIKGGKDIMVNGQHICSAIIESGETYPCILEKFKTNSDMGASEIFRQFEILPRSLGDMISVEANALKLTWPKWVSTAVVGAAVIEKLKTRSGTISAAASRTVSLKRSTTALTSEQKVKLLGDYIPEGHFVCSILTSGVKKKEISHIKRHSIIYAMIKTWQKDNKSSKTFWINVRDGEYLDKDSPEMKLRNFLLLSGIMDTKRQYIKRAITQNEYVYRCFLAWNAFRTGKKSSLAYTAGKPLPVLK